jgi:hypothetical protein
MKFLFATLIISTLVFSGKNCLSVEDKPFNCLSVEDKPFNCLSVEDKPVLSFQRVKKVA